MSTPTVYSPPRLGPTVDLDLSRNEGPPPGRSLLAGVGDSGRAISRYPDVSALRDRIAARHGIEADRVLVTAGGDDALFRCLLARMGPDRRAVVTRPSFEMIPRYVAQVGGTLVEVDWWDGSFPTEEIMGVADDCDIAVVVSPNNPTGGVATSSDLEQLGSVVGLLVVDAAYSEFADHDLTPVALGLDNTVVVRTLSKAWGLAGLRVGYLLGPSDVVGEISAYGSPYPVSGLSADLAIARLDDTDEVSRLVDRVKHQREELTELLQAGGVEVYLSQANFVLARFDDADWVASTAAALGVGLRRFPDRSGLKDHLRITLPGSEEGFGRLVHVLGSALAPQALLFDLDGVLCDTSASQTRAIIETAAGFGVVLTREDVDRAKATGDASDDWELTRRLCGQAGADVTLQAVTDRFEVLYQGGRGVTGYKRAETLLVDPVTLERWAEALPLGVVTGRPRSDTEEFLTRFGLADLMSAVVTRDDAALKPDPAPVRLAMDRLGVGRAWMLGDTPDDITAARGAGVVPIGVIAPGVPPDLARRSLAGAARVIDRTTDLEGLLS